MNIDVDFKKYIALNIQCERNLKKFFCPSSSDYKMAQIYTDQQTLEKWTKVIQFSSIYIHLQDR